MQDNRVPIDWQEWRQIYEAEKDLATENTLLRAGGDALHSESLAETDLHNGAGKVSRAGCLNMTVKQSE